MKYITTKDYAEKLGVIPQRIRALYAQDRLPGAIKIGRDIMIPADCPDPRKPHGKPKKE